ncbi:unnamed protein product [Moneuplotes crassus]|uniref:Uncharacterized protein n=1 Tax=Euplotes crassus TaxID=5936 RepID=A0AAD1X7G3_EUPCR|nr:unnamed protein product [Moneuplotes crassus]
MATLAADKEAIKFVEALSNKKIKEKYKIIDEFTQFIFPEGHKPTKFSKEILSTLLDGDYDRKLIGLCQICCGKRKVSKKLKRSSIAAMNLVHKLLFDHSMSRTVKVFFKSLDPDVYLSMNLGKHFLGSHNSKDDNKALDIIKFIKAERPRLTIDEIVMKEKAYKKLEMILSNFEHDPEEQKKYLIDQVEETQPEQTILEPTEDIQVEDDIRDDGEYLKEPTTWAEVNEDDDLLDINQQDLPSLATYNPKVSAPSQSLSILEDFTHNFKSKSNHDKFSCASTLVEKSVKSYLNHEYIGSDKAFSTKSSRPFIKAMNVLEDVYKELFHTRSYGAVESVAKETLDQDLKEISTLQAKIDVYVKPLKQKLKDLNIAQRAEEALSLEQSSLFYMDEDLVDPAGNKVKTIGNVNKAINEIKYKIENSNLEYKDSDSSAYYKSLVDLYSFLHNEDRDVGAEMATDTMIDSLQKRVLSSFDKLDFE